MQKGARSTGGRSTGARSTGAIPTGAKPTLNSGPQPVQVCPNVSRTRFGEAPKEPPRTSTLSKRPHRPSATGRDDSPATCSDGGMDGFHRVVRLPLSGQPPPGSRNYLLSHSLVWTTSFLWWANNSNPRSASVGSGGKKWPGNSTPSRVSPLAPESVTSGFLSGQRRPGRNTQTVCDTRSIRLRTRNDQDTQ